MYTTGKLYEVEEIDVLRKAGVVIPIILRGASPSITVYVSESKPATIADMVDGIPDVSPFTGNLLLLDAMFRYVAFVGTTDGIEINNITLDEIADIS